MWATQHDPLQAPKIKKRTNDNDTPIDTIMTTFPASNAIRCSYLAFGEGLPGDHRILWADIPYSIIFGNKQPHINRTYAEQFAIQDPRIRKKHNDKVADQHTKQGIIKLAYKTKDAKESGKPIQVVKPLLEELIRKVKKIRQDTAYKIRKKRVGAIPWTPTLQLIRNKQKLWVCVIKRRQGKKSSRNKLRRLQKATRIWNLDNISLQEALDKLEDVKAEHSEHIKDAAKLRKEYLEALAEAIAKENDTTMLTELNNLKLREKQRNTARRIKRLRKKQRSGKVTIMHRTIHRPNQPPIRVACTTQATMTEAAICENESRFSRALVGEFMQPPLRDMLGWYNQELSHLETFWEVCELFGNSLETLRLELGFPGFLTSIPYTRMEKCATTSWMTTLWASSSMFNIQIRDPYPLLPLSRVNDQHIMPIFAADPHLTNTDLPYLNECPMFKEVILASLSQLTTVCGRYLEQLATTPQKAHTFHTCTWRRKPTHLPTSYWTLWKKTILRLFTQPTSNKGELTSPLEEWTTDPTKHWTWWSHTTDTGTRTAYQKGNLHHHTYTAQHRSRRQTRLRSSAPRP